MKLLFLSALLALFPLSARADDVAAPAANLPGVSCVLKTADGQTRFQQGETIRLIASFSADRTGYKIARYVSDRRGMSPLGAIHVTPAEGTTDPLGDLPPQRAFFYSGPPPPTPMALGAKPFEIPFVLNDWVRFDAPGIYTVTLTTPRVFKSNSTAKESPSFEFSPPNSTLTTSTPLQLEITPTGADWASAQVELWRAYWQKRASLSRYAELKPPENDIRFIGTRHAMTAILEHIGLNTEPRSSGDDTYFYRPALIGFADRVWLIGEMKRDLSRPTFPVTQGFLDVLAELEALQTVPRPAGADASFPKNVRDAKGRWVQQFTPAQLMQNQWEAKLGAARNAAALANWKQSAQNVPAKTPAARAMSLHSLLELAWLTNIGKDANVKARVPQLAAQLAPVFDLLPPLPRVYLLENRWSDIQSQRYAPALRRLWQAPAPKENDWDAHDADDLTLRRLYELDPKTGRALITQQIAQPKPRVGFDALKILPDATLPALDQKLAANFEKSYSEADRPLVAQLIGRYATGAIAPRLQGALDKPNETDFKILKSLLAYYLRVEPSLGRAKLELALTSYRKRDYSELLQGVAALQWSPELEKIAISHLTNAGAGVAIDAALTLRRYGSPAARSALLARLQNTADVPYPKVRARIEGALIAALADAQNWLSPPAKLRQIRALCRTDAGRSSVDEYLRSRAGETVHVDYGINGGGYWNVDHYTGRGAPTLRDKLAQFPRGTVFRWQTLSFDRAEKHVFDALQSWVTAHGSTLQRAEKRALPDLISS